MPAAAYNKARPHVRFGSDSAGAKEGQKRAKERLSVTLARPQF
jgi:hypothetical protein